ncbi:hypothetical protein [Streptomyces hokutonensis]|uniref:hypothetical protein n=1 Tax=Streptomyces hokutonensis TaxID=1306990 RepID=UPI00381A8CAB
MEPYNQRLPSLSDVGQKLDGIPYKERKELGREARAKIFRECLKQLVDCLQFRHLQGMKREQIQAHINLGQEMEQALEENIDNPLVTDALLRAWNGWIVESEVFLRSIAQRPNY